MSYRVTFNQKGTFEACYAAEAWCQENGISWGPMDGPGNPIGLMLGDFHIAKWTNLTRQEQAACHGTMTGNFREGPVVITMKEVAP